ncbi:MAG: cupin domain-containing protein, partial [Pedobacter sp.]|nr:cupin domain-containing protein [Pedobacter sp.]
QQVFFILFGTASCTIDGSDLKVNANESIHVKPLTIHSILNSGDDELQFLVISEPMAHRDRVEVSI